MDLPSIHDDWIDEEQYYELVDEYTYVEIVATGSVVQYTATAVTDSEIPRLCTTASSHENATWSLRLLITPQAYTREWHRLPYSPSSANALRKHWHMAPSFRNLSSYALTFDPVPGDPSWSGFFLRFLYELPLVCTFTTTHHRPSNTTYALCFGLSQANVSQFLAQLERLKHCAYAPYLGPLLVTDLALTLLERFSTKTYLDFVPVRESLGCNPYFIPAQGEGAPDVLDLPRQLTALADAVASNAFCVEATEGTILCLESEVESYEAVGQSLVGITAVEVGVRDQLRMMKQVVANTKRRNVYMKDSVQAQVQMVYALLAQKDNELTHRYGADMRVIAIVTLLFLPGTFVATLFSASFWDFAPNNRGEVVSRWVWLYWGITVALTATVLGVWKWHPKCLNGRRRRDGDEESGKKEV